MEYVDFSLSGDPTSAKQVITDALTARKFRVQWSDEWTGVAERGNKVANALLGAFAQYFKVDVVIRTDESTGTGVVRLARSSRGMMGGAVGVHRTNKNMRTLADELTTAFQASGVLLGRTDAT